jgi:hypothetical protein
MRRALIEIRVNDEFDRANKELQDPDILREVWERPAGATRINQDIL